MAIERGWTTTVCVSLGLAALVFAWLPGAWPNPLPEGRIADLGAVVALRRAAAAVDAACQRGDVQAFAAATTEAHRQEFAQTLQTIDRRIEPRTLREIGARSSQLRWFDAEALAARVRGPRVAIAVRRPDGAGAQVLSFAWDGRQFRFDGSVQARQAVDAVGASAAVDAALALR